MKLLSKKFQTLRRLRAWPHSVIHDIRCEPTRRWLADGLLIVKCWLGSSRLGCTTFGYLFAKAGVEQMAAMCATDSNTKNVKSDMPALWEHLERLS